MDENYRLSVTWETRKSINTFVQSFYYNVNLERRKSTIFFLYNKIVIIFTQKCFIRILFGNDPKVMQKNIRYFWFRQWILSFLKLSPLGKRNGPFIRRNLNSLHPTIICAEFGWNWSCDSWPRRFSNDSLRTIDNHRRQQIVIGNLSNSSELKM